MKASQIGTAIIFVTVAFAAFQNCAPPSSAVSKDSQPVVLRSLTELQDQLKTLSESDLSCNTASDCKLIPAGTAPCGGPDYFLVTSANNEQMQSLESLAQEYSYQDKIQTRPDLVGICAMRVPEIAQCVSHVCIKAEETF